MEEQSTAETTRVEKHTGNESNPGPQPPRNEKHVRRLPQTDWIVHITLTTEGNLDVGTDPLVVRRGDTVRWISEQGSHSGHFVNTAPGTLKGWFAEQAVNSDSLTIAQNAAAGLYKYALALFTGTTTHIVDPDLQVVDDTSKGTETKPVQPAPP